MFERFTTEARDVVVAAQGQARQLGHPYIGTEHLLLALLAPEAGITQTVLGEAGVDPARVRADIDRLLGPPGRVLTDQDAVALQAIGIDVDAVLARIEQALGPDALASPRCSTPRRGLLRRRERGTPTTLRFSRRAKKVLELSLREALALHHNYIGAEHILLAVLREGSGLAAKILTGAGLNLDELRQATLNAMSRAA